MRQWHIAQMNVGTIRYPTDDPRMHGFMSRLDEINELAEASDAFAWRLQSDSGNATDIDAGRGPDFLVNMSTWTSIDGLFEFVYRTAHRGLMVDRKQWFARPGGKYQVLWWVPAGHEPSIAEGLARLDLLEEHGPTPDAFTFQKRFPPPDSADDADDVDTNDMCSGWQ